MREQIAQQPPLKRRASAAQYELTRRMQEPDTEEDEIPDSHYPQRIPPSARRYTSDNNQVYEQGNRRIIIHQSPPPRQRRRIHPLLTIGIVASVIIAGVILLSQAEAWWTNQQNQWKYGYPRLYQTDAVVGHNDDKMHPSHFIALNLNGKVQIIEVPGGDVTHEKVYVGPQLFGENVDLIPVTLSFKDVNGDGKPDMLIHLQDQTVVFLNDGSQFKPTK